MTNLLVSLPVIALKFRFKRAGSLLCIVRWSPATFPATLPFDISLRRLHNPSTANKLEHPIALCWGLVGELREGASAIGVIHLKGPFFCVGKIQ